MYISDLLMQSVVVFSRSYMPITQINVKRAIVLLVTGKAEPLELDERLGNRTIAVHSPNMVLLVPPYIRLTVSYRERPWRIPPVNRREVLRRDRHTCQYCGNTRQLTIDHVIPRSKGGKHTWDNVVTACEHCNNLKSDRSPQQAGLTLRTVPKTPAHPAVAFADEFWQQHKN